jgi:RNA polymerase sigma-70 factor (ECF subfamily)
MHDSSLRQRLQESGERKSRLRNAFQIPESLLESASTAHVRQAIWKALGELPEMYREVFVLRDVQHLDVNETAQVLGIGESAVKTRLHRARLIMRESLTPMFARPKVSFWERWRGMNPWLAAKR